MTSLFLNIEESKNSDNNTNPREFRKYWCHLCQKDFSQILDESSDTKCVFCGKTFCELIQTTNPDSISHPRNFKPYNVNSNNNNHNNNSNNDSEGISDILMNIINSSYENTPQLLTTHFIASNLQIINLGLFDNDNNFDNIMNNLMMMDNNKYGNPPASKNAVEKLKKIKLDKEKINEFLNKKNNFCAVCKDAFNTGEECLVMPCEHFFHGGCIIPWLNLRNSCPVCRFELPTDDKDFELMKKEKNKNRIGNNNNFNLNENGN